LILVGWIRILAQEGKNGSHKNRKSYEISCFEVLDVFLLGMSSDVFSCSLEVLCGGFGLSKTAIFDQKNIFFQL
jgi:hypothetical protein